MFHAEYEYVSEILNFEILKFFRKKKENVGLLSAFDIFVERVKVQSSYHSTYPML